MNKILTLTFGILIAFYCQTIQSHYAIHEGKDIVKKVYAKPNLFTLTATAGFGSRSQHDSSIKNYHSYKSLSHLSRNPRSDNSLSYIPPNFITGAHLMPGNTALPDESQSNSKHWSLSTPYDSSINNKSLNKIKQQSFKENQPKNSDSSHHENMQSYLLSDQEQGLPDNHYFEEKLSHTDPLQKYQVVISSQYDSPIFDNQVPEVATYRASFPNDMYSNNEALYYESMGDKLPEEKEISEQAKPVIRSAIPWAQRDLYNQQQPRHIACTQPLDRGVGPDEVSSWFYDSQDGRCRWFGYRGYAGNANRFYSRSACEGLCIEDSENLCEKVKCLWPSTSCVLVGDESCKDYKQRRDKSWEAECPPDQPVCLSRRNTRMAPDIDFHKIPPECRQEADAGTCITKNPSVNFFYDISRNDCMAFYFHECGGNDNRFETKSECMSHCSP